MEDLFSNNAKTLAPLADRMRPRTLDEFVGQSQIVGPGKLLRRAIEADRLTSSIFWGPPGCGKTTLASIIAETTRATFVKLNAVTSGVADVREVLRAAEERLKLYGQPDAPVLEPENEKITVREAIEGFTINNAYQMHMDSVVGSIEVGKYADFVILEENILEIPAERIHCVKVCETIMDGTTTYKA